VLQSVRSRNYCGLVPPGVSAGSTGRTDVPSAGMDEDFGCGLLVFVGHHPGSLVMVIFIRGKLRPESENPISRVTQALYLPVLRLCLKYRKTTLLLNLAFLFWRSF
jgi:hypothetical protein